jgi:hypothetical protein
MTFLIYKGFTMNTLIQSLASLEAVTPHSDVAPEIRALEVPELSAISGGDVIVSFN